MKEDKTLVCKECGKEFVFTAGEQEFYAERGFQNEPQRCKACRDARKTVRFTAVTATTHITENNKQIQPAVKMRQVFCLFQRIL